MGDGLGVSNAWLFRAFFLPPFGGGCLSKRGLTWGARRYYRVMRAHQGRSRGRTGCARSSQHGSRWAADQGSLSNVGRKSPGQDAL